MLAKNFSITMSPSTPPLETVEELVFQVTSPFDDKSVTLAVNPALGHYEEDSSHKDIEIKHTIGTTPTEDTRELHLSLGDNSSETFELNNKTYKLVLMQVVQIELNGQTFPSFEFYIEEAE